MSNSQGLNLAAGRVWDAGEVMARALAYPEWSGRHCRQKRVLELGAGTGVVGLMALALGAESVALTDRVLGVAESNLRLNFPSAADQERCMIRRLKWGDQPVITALKSEVGGAFDLIVSADTLYESTPGELLAETISSLAGPATTVLIASPNPGRTFFEAATEVHQFQVEEVTDDPAVVRATSALAEQRSKCERSSPGRKMHLWRLTRSPPTSPPD